MKQLILIIIINFGIYGCKKEMKSNSDITSYSTNGEAIFRTGKNKNGEVLQDINSSEMKMVHSCQNCHGSDGKGGDIMMRNTPSIRYKDLINPKIHTIPYNDSLIIRFIDHELKSDGTKANTGVVFKMSLQDKKDLINYLKIL
ncbi:MAG: hypothetical protein RIQ33_1533 [Bacteroidota bacterium]|jgi:hypothetical protein